MFNKFYLIFTIIAICLLTNIYYVNAAIPGFSCQLRGDYLKINNLEKKDCFDIVNFSIHNDQKIFPLKGIILHDDDCVDRIKKEVSGIINFENIASYNLQPGQEYFFKIIQEHLNSNLPDPLVVGYFTNINTLKELPTCNIPYQVKKYNFNYFYYFGIIIFLLIIIVIGVKKLYFSK